MTSPNRMNPASSNPPDSQGFDRGKTSAPEILALWERGRTTTPALRGTALAAAANGESLGTTGAQPVGERDRSLLELRRRLIGESVEARATCPECMAQIETHFALADLLSDPEEKEANVELDIDGLTFVIRPPSADQVAQLAQTGGNVESLRETLIELCVVSCTDAAGAAVDVPPHTHSSICTAVETLDPLAAISVRLSCPDCGTEIDLHFDPAEFVWNELETAAQRLLWEVDQIARVYHWTESDILALTPARRRAYLGMVHE